MTRLALAPALALMAIGLAACGGESNPVRDLAIRSGITGGEPRPAPDFITNSRPPAVDYAPVGVSAPPRSTRPKEAGAISDAEKEMNALRARNEGRGAAARQAGKSSAPAAPVVAPPE